MNQAFMGHLVPKFWQAPSIRIELEHATIYYYKCVLTAGDEFDYANFLGSFMMPHIYHYIQITDKHTEQTHTQKHYSFGPSWSPEPWWSTYR